MKKLLLIVVAMLVIAAPAYAQASWTDGFDYADGMLNYNGIWQYGSQTTQINVTGGTVHVTNSADDRNVRGQFATAFTSSQIITTLQFNRTIGPVPNEWDWLDGWLARIMYKDSAGKLLAQWQIAASGCNGRISTATSSVNFVQGWNDLKAVIDMTTNTSQYFLNNVSIGTVAFEAGALDELATVTIYKGMDARASANGAPDAIFDNFSVTAVPEPGSIVAMCSGLIGMVGFARRRRA